MENGIGEEMKNIHSETDTGMERMKIHKPVMDDGD